MTWPLALRLGRVSNLPTVWTNVLAASVLAGTPRTGVTVALIALACSLSYVGGMFLNDAFDRAYDARVRPERPIPSGAISARAVFVWGFGLLAAGAALLVAVAASRAAGVAALALAALIVLYDAWHKDNPFGPLLMGLCRVMVYVCTAVALTGTIPAVVLGGAVVLLGYLMGLTYVARQENLRVDLRRTVMILIAGISLIDALLIAAHGSPGTALVAVLGFALTLGLQRWVPGT